MKTFRVKLDQGRHSVLVRARSHMEAYRKALEILKIREDVKATVTPEWECGTAAKLFA